MRFRERHHPNRSRAGILLCILALLVTPAMAAAAGVSPTNLDDRDNTSKVLPRSPVVADGTDIKNINTAQTYATIQAALDDPGTLDGHVLEVQVASHAEGIVNVNKSVTIQGGGGGAAITSTTDTGSSGDARAWFLVSAPNVTFQDLSFDGSGNAIYQALRFNAAGGLVQRCDVAHIAYSTYLGMAVVSFENLTVDECTFTDIERLGVILFGSGVTAGVVSDCTYTGKGDGDWLDYGIELGGGAVATLTNNTISGCTGVASSDGSTSAGVIITTYYGLGTGGTLTGNFLNGNTTGIADGYDGADASAVVAHDNDLSGNDVGVQNTNAANIADCSSNWWGSNDAATVGTSAGAGVDYTPWLHVGTDTGGGAGFQGDFSALHVDDDSPQTGALTRIAEAIGLVSGSTVYLAPGNYPGSVIVNTKLTLQGSGDGTNPAVDTILLPTAGAVGITIQVGGTGVADRCVIRDLRISGGSNGLRINDILGYLTLQNLTVTGTSSYGFEIHNTADVTDLVMTDVDLVNIASIGMRVRGKLNGLTMTNGHMDGNVYGMQSVTGTGEGNNFLNVAVTGTTFDNNTSKGMYLEKLSDAVFDGISVANSGTSGAWAAGIDINLKYADYQNIEIRNSTITGCGTGDVTNGVGVTVKARTDGAYSTSPATLTNVDLIGNTISGCQNGIRFGEPTKNNPGPTLVDVHENLITGSVGVGLDNASLTTTNASCNWWGSALGPNVPPGNPSPGDGITGSATYTAWWTTASGPCNGYGLNTVSAVVGACISIANPCLTVPVDIARTTSENVRGFSVTLTLSPELMLCSGLASVTEGTYLSSIGGLGSTAFQVLDIGGGSYVVDCAILGLPCGATAATGNLFNLALKASGSDGTGTVTVTNVILRDCANAPVPATPGPVATVTIDTAAPTAITNLAAAQVKSSNDGDGTTKIALTFTAPGDAATVEVYRAGFGQYPEYDDNGGVVPATPSYPPAGPWVLTGVTATGQTDEVATRDFWYYVVFTKDACGNVSAVSNKTTGTLNYHLGDVAPSGGNNLVLTVDISDLGFNYGVSLGVSDPLGYLDVGPTTDYSVDGRPTTDNQVQFEDLIMFAINYGQVSKQRLDATPAQNDEIVVLVPESADANALIDAHLWLRGTGRVQGLSARLEWDPAVVTPVGVEPGDLVRALDGVAFTPEPGVVDVALLGVRSLALAGEGDLATVRFRVIGSGNPGIALAAIDARDSSNRKVEMNAGAQAGPEAAVPRATSLLANVPNPFNPTTRIPYTLAASGTVDLAVYTVDGRRVRTLFMGERQPGLYDATWDGTDERGDRVSSGVYYVRLATRDLTRSRPIVLLK